MPGSLQHLVTVSKEGIQDYEERVRRTQEPTWKGIHLTKKGQMSISKKNVIRVYLNPRAPKDNSNHYSLVTSGDAKESDPDSKTS